jgi:hypothetical protein
MGPLQSVRDQGKEFDTRCGSAAGPDTSSLPAMPYATTRTLQGRQIDKNTNQNTKVHCSTEIHEVVQVIR